MVDTEPAQDPRAREVLGILDAGGYESASGDWVDLTEAQRASEDGTLLYTPESLSGLRGTIAPKAELPPVEVVDATTPEAAFDLAPKGPVALLNFASARNPGGGFLNGARAQEEELCRCSGLYRTLLSQPTYYAENRDEPSLLYTDHVIYSPDVPFFRTSGQNSLLSRPFLASVITAPAPNRGALLRREPSAVRDIPATFERRWANVLAVARAQGHRTVILGAWGCGAFQNDPRVAARTAEKVLATKPFAEHLDRVLFAIPSAGRRSKHNLEAFREVLGHIGRET